MKGKNAKWSLLTEWLLACDKQTITLTWNQLGEIVGPLPISATDHFEQWWYGDRPNTRAWRAAGYELVEVKKAQTVTLTRSADTAKGGRKRAIRKSSSDDRRPSGGPLKQLDVEGFAAIDLKNTLIIMCCSKGKERGGIEKTVSSSRSWPPELLVARDRLRERAQVDDHLVLPAWQRYNGYFYKATETSLGDAVTERANIVILSGGYGVVRVDEEIGWYEQPMKKGQWPRGVIESALISEAVRVSARYVVAFAARTSDYAKIIKNTNWRKADVERAVLVTSHSNHGNARMEVPRDLGQAFRALWLGLIDQYPADVWCEELP